LILIKINQEFFKGIAIHDTIPGAEILNIPCLYIPYLVFIDIAHEKGGSGPCPKDPIVPEGAVLEIVITPTGNAAGVLTSIGKKAVLGFYSIVPCEKIKAGTLLYDAIVQ
jgi:hypothetical protein